MSPFHRTAILAAVGGVAVAVAVAVAADLIAKGQVGRTAVAYDSVPMGNLEGTPANPATPTANPWTITPRKDGTHYWQSSGYATVVTVP